MPNKNGTGPSGEGSRSGRGMGNCAGEGGTGTGPGTGRGNGGTGRGPGRGNGRRGRGRAMNNTADSNQDNSWLQTQLNNLQNAIQRLTDRLDNSK